MNEVDFNPCFCTSVKCGTITIGAFDLIYGALYMGRLKLLQHMANNYKDYYPESNRTKSEEIITSGEMQFSNYGLICGSGLVLLFTVMYLPLRMKLLACYAWLLIRFYLTIIMSILSHIMLQSNSVLYRNYGAEVLGNIILHFYFALVVWLYSKDIRDDLINSGSYKPTFGQANNKSYESKNGDANENTVKRPQPPKAPNQSEILSSSVYDMTPHKFLMNYYKYGDNKSAGESKSTLYMNPKIMSGQSSSDSDEEFNDYMYQIDLNQVISVSSVNISSGRQLPSFMSLMRPREVVPGNEFVKILPKIRKSNKTTAVSSRIFSSPSFGTNAVKKI